MAAHGDDPNSDARGAIGATCDALFGGAVPFAQPGRGGYRVNVDALLLADFARRERPSPISFDLGAGAGAVALALLHKRAVERAVLVEIDGDTAALARRNVDASGWTARAEVIAGDVLAVADERRGEARLVVCNPPYVEPGHGRVAASSGRARARSGELARFTSAARVLAGRRARVCFVYPAHDLARLFDTLRASGLEPKRLRLVHARETAPARVALVEASPAKAGGLSVMAPLFERVNGRESDELLAITR